MISTGAYYSGNWAGPVTATEMSILGTRPAGIRVLKIGSHEFEVETINDPTHEDGSRLLGDSCYEELKIRLRADMRGSIHRETLIHEVMHMIVHIYGLDQLEGKEEETMVSTMAAGLAQVCVDNPWFVEALS